MASAIKNFLKMESASGIILMLVAALAMLIANSPVAVDYQRFMEPLQLPIKDGLMVIFFWLIGLEIKRELVEGELSTAKKAALPLIGAAGGVILPALIYVYFNHGTANIRGWAVPCATDIAFALGVVALFGNRMNSALKVFLMALAVIDDLIAVMIIALFYSDGLSYSALGGVLACVIVLWSMNRSGSEKILPYLLIGLVLWVCMLLSGIHATVAGVLLGLLMPLDLAKRSIHALHPWVAFGVMPIFAFANAGVPLAGISIEQIIAPMPLGIMLGLFVGKQLGIFSFCWLAVKMGFARLPERATWLELYAVGMIAGIGFTMSLFVGALAFTDAAEQNAMRLGVLIGSLLSALCGSAVMAYALRRKLSKP